MTTHVSFELAKLLKEKGFDKIGKFYYPDDGNLLNKNKGSIRHIAYRIQAPTIAEVVMWLYEKHMVWISVSMENNEEDKISFYYSITENVDSQTYFRIRKSNYNSPTEAYEAAIEYTLKNLI